MIKTSHKKQESHNTIHKKVEIKLRVSDGGKNRKVTLLSLSAPLLAQPLSFPSGVLQTECRTRSFWILVDKAFLVSKQWQLEALNDTGFPDVMQTNRATQCGYTITKDVYDNVEVRISFLGCWVKNINDQQFTVTVQFRVTQSGRLGLYPVSMSCIPDAWDVREIACEENYMEVSVTRIIPPAILKIINLSGPVVSISQRWQVWFNNSNVPIPAQDAINKGYGVNATVTRVLFRSPYVTPESQIVELGNFHLDVVASNMLYSQTLLRIIVDTTIACPNDPPVFTDSALSWFSPAVLSPLITGGFTTNELAMGVNGKLLNSTQLAAYKYILRYDFNEVEVTVPYGAPGGYVESDIVNNTYTTEYRIHLLLQRQWLGINEDDSTTHTSYKPIIAPKVVHVPVFLNHTIKEDGYFNVSLGNFYSDMSVKSFIIYSVPLTLDELPRRQMTIETAVNPNDTRAFYLTVPFSDPVVEQTYLGGAKRRYRLYVTYILLLLPQNKNLTYSGVVDCIIEDAVPPSITSHCENDRLVINVERGNMDNYWLPYIRELPLNNALITSQNIIVQNSVTALDIEVPYTAVGLTYEVIGLDTSVASLNFTFRHNVTQEIKFSHAISCPFPTRGLLCLSNGTMIAVVDSTVTKPAFDAHKAHLRDPNCTPSEATSEKALFSFAAYTCGTTRRFDGDYLVYENEVTFDRQVLFPEQPIISRDSSYRLTLRCRYPIRDTLWIGGQHRNAVSGIATSRAKGGSDTFSIVLDISTLNQLVWLSILFYGMLRRRARHHMADLKLAKDESYTAFYQDGDFPVSVQPTDVLHFQADVQSPEPMAELKDCWATTLPNKNGMTQWELIVDGCGVAAEDFSTDVQASSERSPRFKVKLQEPPISQLSIYCNVIICDAITHRESCTKICNQTERLMDKRSAPLAMELVSAGPVQIVGHQSGVMYQHIEKSWSTWTWVLPLGLAVISAFFVGAIVLSVRLFTR
ncbi:uncharacterized protein [Phyllobates terribilis]|uniref:uncharacterized protein n=1 Tax=Phyllobates terribilis TaxID=111132 RepID=UPI003CCB19A6